MTRIPQVRAHEDRFLGAACGGPAIYGCGAGPAVYGCGGGSAARAEYGGDAGGIGACDRGSGVAGKGTAG